MKNKRALVARIMTIKKTMSELIDQMVSFSRTLFGGNRSRSDERRIRNTNKSEINIPDQYGFTPLIRAIKSGYIAAAKKLILNGADISYTTHLNKYNAFMYAVFLGEVNLVKFFLDNTNTDVNFRDKHGCSVILWAALDGFLDIVQVLLDYGADANVACDKGLRPINVASCNGHREVVSLLFEHLYGSLAKVIDRDLLVIICEYV
jgi:ankyrin repeat protein